MVSNVEPTVPQPRLLGPRQSLPAGSRGRTALDVWEKRLKSWPMGFLTFWWGVRDRERRLWAGGSRCSVSLPLHYFALDSSGKLEIFSTNNLFQVLPNRSPNHSMKHNRATYLNHWKKKGPQQECKNLNSGTLSHLRTRIIHWPLISRLSEWEWSLKPMQWQNSRHRAFVYFNIKIVKNINGYLCTNNVYCVNTCFRFYILLTSQIKLLICLTNVVAGSQNYFPSTMRFNYWSCPTIFSFQMSHLQLGPGQFSRLLSKLSGSLCIVLDSDTYNALNLFSFSSKDVNVFQFLELIRFADNNHHSFAHISFVRWRYSFEKK